MTISRAYALLEEEGVLERRPGLPLVVRARSGATGAAARSAQFTKALRPVVVDGPAAGHQRQGRRRHAPPADRRRREVMTVSTPVFEASGLTKEFGEVTALRDVSLALAGPSIIGLIGRNASGKTTLLRHIVGLQLPTRGGARTLGVRDRTPGARAVRAHRRGAADPDVHRVDVGRRAAPLPLRASTRAGTPAASRSCSTCSTSTCDSEHQRPLDGQRAEARHRGGALPPPGPDSAGRAGQQPRPDRARPVPQVPARHRPGRPRDHRHLEPRAARHREHRGLDRVPRRRAASRPTRRWTT